MICKSTRSHDQQVSFREAVSRGLAPDGGLYVPVGLPNFPLSFWQQFRGKSLDRIATVIFQELLGDEFEPDTLRSICKEVFNFDAPIVPLAPRAGVMELYHGPTLAFKDFGARFMSRILPLCKRTENEAPITVLTATSGDTGAAVAQGFHGVEGIRAVVLYPKGKVSPLQERQFATLGDNVIAVAVEGTFDDCQRLVKSAFSNEGMVTRFNLTSANSINIARLLPQMIYYISGWSMIPQGVAGEGVTFIVPSGNLGNLVAGLIAAKMGLPGVRFIISSNANDVLPDFLNGNPFEPRPSVQTISNAMDVGNPSNFERLRYLLGSDDQIRSELSGACVDDDTTRQVIQKVYARHKYLVDPHTATALEVWNNKMSEAAFEKRYGIVLSTAHPAKFGETIEPLLPGVLQMPDSLSALKDLPLRNVSIEAHDHELGALLDTL